MICMSSFCSRLSNVSMDNLVFFMLKSSLMQSLFSPNLFKTYLYNILGQYFGKFLPIN